MEYKLNSIEFLSPDVTHQNEYIRFLKKHFCFTKSASLVLIAGKNLPCIPLKLIKTLFFVSYGWLQSALLKSLTTGSIHES
jgi:hypothetical protein